MSDLPTYDEFFTEVLKGLSLPVTPEAKHALYSVSTLEGLQGRSGTGPQRYNPLNSVVPHGDSTSWNSVHVQDYKSFENGVAGTIELLRGSPWDGVRHAIADGGTVEDILAAFAAVYDGWDPGIHESSFPRNPALGNKEMTEHGPIPAPHEPPPANDGGKNNGNDGGSKVPAEYTVLPGDTLRKIAFRFYGNPNRFIDIATANGLRDPNLIRVGETLKLPRA